jgi:HEAT repeat protein
MMRSFRMAGLVLALAVTGVSAAIAQPSLVDLMARHGVEARAGRLDAAFDAHLGPTVPVMPGSFATPLALLSSATGIERIDGAYAFGILAGRSGRAASSQELNAAGQSLIQMIHSEDRRSRIAGARVAGRVFAAPFDTAAARPAVPPGMTDAVFTMLNRDDEYEQLAAMDALGLLREINAVTSLTERYRYYRDARRRALAGGAIEALARIGTPSAVELVKQLAGDPWADGKDATALAVAFARERTLRDGSIVTIQQALNDKARRDQARGYLEELGAPVP